MHYKILFILIILTILSFTVYSKRFDPTWESLDTRVAPQWYDDVKFGIFIHWGVFSVPSFRSEWFWNYWKIQKHKDVINFMQKNYPPDFTYADFAREFTAEFFNPDEWTDLFKASGAKYIVFVAKHHEGFTNWPSEVSFNWNSMDVGPHRDIVGELAHSIRNRSDIHFGLYHSMYEWFNPLYLQDKENNFTTNDFVIRKTGAELYELVNRYHPEVIWSDGDGAASDQYWNSTHFLAWLYNDSPVKDKVLVNDRWGRHIACHHGDFYNCNDRYNPGVLQKHKWENAMTIDVHSWGYRRDGRMRDMLSTHDILKQLVITVSCGGNLLLNIGPTRDGRIIPLFEERLRDIGAWLEVNGEAIYNTTHWSFQNDTLTKDVWYTKPKYPLEKHENNIFSEIYDKVLRFRPTKKSITVYAILLEWKTNKLSLGSVQGSSKTKVSLLGYEGIYFNWARLSANSTIGITVDIPAIPVNKMPCQWAWVLKITNVLN